jgi:hypothetical protein
VALGGNCGKNWKMSQGAILLDYGFHKPYGLSLLYERAGNRYCSQGYLNQVFIWFYGIFWHVKQNFENIVK